MIKKIIFDVDNTLIPWLDEENWNKVYNALMKKYELTIDEFKDVKNVVNNYELIEDIFDANKMQKMINSAIQKDYSNDFLEIILSTFAECVPEKDPKIEETMQYLSSKYELVALTNWFTVEQEKRLDKFGILSYFTKVYGADTFKIKPNKEAFDVAIGSNLPSECLMVGDGIENDVKPAIKYGLDAILVDNNYSKTNQENKFKTIKNVTELRKLL